MMDDPDPIEIPIDGILDLHTFQPREVKDLLPDYLAVCRERKILRVRVIHGKGTGSLRRTVHAILERMPEVISFKLAGAGEGNGGRPWSNSAPWKKNRNESEVKTFDFRAREFTLCYSPLTSYRAQSPGTTTIFILAPFSGSPYRSAEPPRSEERMISTWFS